MKDSRTHRPRMFNKESEKLRSALKQALNSFIEQEIPKNLAIQNGQIAFNIDRFMKWLFSDMNGFTAKTEVDKKIKRYPITTRSLATKVARLILQHPLETGFVDVMMGRIAPIYRFKSEDKELIRKLRKL